jgi:bifunctional UDP-N-acetylglucosamine pyrophosphorylase/glucosamine-1-phosphate N-acetyltransferase
MEKYAAVILAAGKGTRMNEGSASPIPKVMFPLNGKPIIDWSVQLIRDVDIQRIVLVVGYKKELIQDYFGKKVEYAIQEEQLGTGHAVAQARLLLGGQSESVIVFYGDSPLYRPESIKRLMGIHEEQNATISMLTVVSKEGDLTGYGRVFRNELGHVSDIIEHKDCSAEQLKCREWNPGFYIFNANWLWDNISKLEANNTQKEYYLTDMIHIAKEQGMRVCAEPVSDENEALGINNPDQLNQAEQILKNREQIQN